MPSVIKNVGPKLIPFFKTLAIYFVVFIPYNKPGIIAALLKCLPIVSLMIFVVWYGKHIAEEYKPFPRRIFYGLLFSCVGDFCLIWPEYFPLGMVSFGLCHINYIMAFGFRPLNLPLAAFTYTLAGIVCILLMPDLTGILVPGVPVYTTLLITMMWRAVARVQFQKKLWSWSQICTCLGAILFVISDLLIVLTLCKFKIPYDQLFIMTTYYAGQLGIALSIVDVKRGCSQKAN